MFSHIFVGADDVAVSKKFYDAALATIGVAEGKMDPKGRCFYRTPTGTIGFACDSPEKVKAFHDAAVANGGTSIEDPPGWREGGAVRLYLAYVRDPYGNKLCALHRGG